MGPGAYDHLFNDIVKAVVVIIVIVAAVAFGFGWLLGG